MLKQMIKEARLEMTEATVSTGRPKGKRGPYCTICHARLSKTKVDGRNALQCPRHGLMRFTNPVYPPHR